MGVRPSFPSPPLSVSRTKPRAELQAIPKFCLGYAAHGFVFGGLECKAGIIRVVMNELAEDILHDASNCDITGVPKQPPSRELSPALSFRPSLNFVLGMQLTVLCFGGLECAGIIRVVMNELGEDISHDASNCDITVFQSVCHLNNGVSEDGWKDALDSFPSFRENISVGCRGL
ncbi:hypothetical protein CEXT_706111 [Caerostris extrusa]|uniref:Uncharacterized protein n=1 Tax=Caerostris extrusa TaxID=172846 RepID=A0AAV4XEB2_CAEEX|nr:hypothetical protein CEXT_706111 [Caerostris extrusa]